MNVRNPEKEYATVTRREGISSANLIKALTARGLDVEAVKKVCSEVAYCKTSTGGTGYGIGYPTIRGGFVIWNPRIGRLNFVGPAGLSFVPDEFDCDTLHIFDQLADYLLYISKIKNRPHEDALIINSVFFISHATAFLVRNRYAKVICSLKDTNVGKEEFMKIQATVPHATVAMVL